MNSHRYNPYPRRIGRRYLHRQPKPGFTYAGAVAKVSELLALTGIQYRVFFCDNPRCLEYHIERPLGMDRVARLVRVLGEEGSQ